MPIPYCGTRYTHHNFALGILVMKQAATTQAAQRRRARWLGLGLLLAVAQGAIAQTLPPAWPDQPLAVTSCAPTQALAGTRIVVHGQGFVGVSSVRFNGIEAEEFTIDSPTQLTALVPALASSGFICVSTAAGQACTDQALEIPPEVVVQGAQTLRGAYARLVVGPAGTATLSGPVTVLGTLVVQRGGHLNLGDHVVTGGSFVAAPGATLRLSHPAGLALDGPSGSVQTSARSFSPEAYYIYCSRRAGSQTGTGLPSQVSGLAVASPAGLTLTADVAISGALSLGGNLTLGPHTLTLLTEPTLGPALLLGPGAVLGPVRVQQAGKTPLSPTASAATTLP